MKTTFRTEAEAQRVLARAQLRGIIPPYPAYQRDAGATANIDLDLSRCAICDDSLPISSNGHRYRAATVECRLCGALTIPAH